MKNTKYNFDQAEGFQVVYRFCNLRLKNAAGVPEFENPNSPARKARVALMAKRLAAGLDLYSGLPLGRAIAS